MVKHGKRFEGIVKARIDKVKIQVSHDIVNTTAKTRYLRTYACDIRTVISEAHYLVKIPRKTTSHSAISD